MAEDEDRVQQGSGESRQQGHLTRNCCKSNKLLLSALQNYFRISKPLPASRLLVSFTMQILLQHLNCFLKLKFKFRLIEGGGGACGSD